MLYRAASAALCAGLFLTLLGCGQRQPPATEPEPLVVPVSHPVSRKVTDYMYYTGRTDAKDSVGIRARVTGYLKKVAFTEGAEVKKGDLLFEIDPRPYQAQYDAAKAQVKLNEASLRLAQTTYERNRSAVARVTGAVSAQELDQNRAAIDEALERIRASQAALEVYKLNLEFTRVTSPIDGQTSRYFLTLGNLVVQDQTLLTTVVSLDPMYAYFDMDEPTLEDIKRAINAGKIPRPRRGDIPVYLGLPGEPGYPHRGTINFANNVVNPSTGTIAVRGVFANPRPPNGVRLMAPGMFLRIQLPIGPPQQRLLVIDRAVGTDQELKFVYVVADGKVQYRRVTIGPLQDDGLRVIKSGLKPTDWVVVGAIQQVRPNMEVQIDKMPMPTLPLGSRTPAPVSGKPLPPPGLKRQGDKVTR
jgi:multidrug efflux system membrane fusion protein